jgi:DNA-directed RNA polymerase subunit F
MSSIKVVSETPITMAEVKAELVKIKKRDTELNFRAGKCEDYLNQVNVLSSQKADELKEALEKLSIPRIKPEQIVKIIDVLPATVEDVKSVFQGYTINVSQESMKKIVDVVAKFISK